MMSAETAMSTEETARRNYQRLFMLRNAEIVLIVLGLVIATLYFELALPLPPLLVTLTLIAGLNVYTWWRLHTGHSYGNGEIFTLMLLDVAGLTAVFFFTGGASNPFVWFYLLPLMIAATILPRWHTWTMAAVTVLCYSALFLIDAPATGEHAHHHAEGFQMHVLGMWLGFVMSAGFVAVIIVGMAQSLRERDHRLAEIREQALRNERLVALGTLAAGTAHELGTPLGTMAILTAELQQDYSGEADGTLRKKLDILQRQIERCKEALSSLSSSAGAGRAESGHRMPVAGYLDAVIDEWRDLRPTAQLRLQVEENAPGAEIIAERTLTQALINVLDNAADASPEHVALDAAWTATELALDIADRGPGLSEDLIARLGRQPVSTKQEGLGVGLFLAHATIERLGGRLDISNRAEGGTRIHIVLPLLANQDRGTGT
jgi:two-component system sensor histidine kinase RegB